MGRAPFGGPYLFLPCLVGASSLGTFSGMVYNEYIKIPEEGYKRPKCPALDLEEQQLHSVEDSCFNLAVDSQKGWNVDVRSSMLVFLLL